MTSANNSLDLYPDIADLRHGRQFGLVANNSSLDRSFLLPNYGYAKQLACAACAQDSKALSHSSPPLPSISPVTRSKLQQFKLPAPTAPPLAMRSPLPFPVDEADPVFNVCQIPASSRFFEFFQCRRRSLGLRTSSGGGQCIHI